MAIISMLFSKRFLKRAKKRVPLKLWTSV